MSTRRAFITLLGGAAAAWPMAARAQRSTSVIGVLSGSSLVGLENRMANFRRGLAETGYVEGRNLTIEVSLGGRTVRPSPDACEGTG